MYKEQGKKLKELREAKGSTLARVAKKLEVTTNYLSLIERGQRKPSEVVMYRLAEFYNLNPIEIFSLYGTVPTDQLERVISSPALVRILSNLSADDSFTEEEKDSLSQALQQVVENLLEKRGDKKQ